MKQQYSREDQDAIIRGTGSYVYLDTPRAAVPGADPKYSMQMLISKDDEKTISALKRAIEAAKYAGKNSHWGGKEPSNLKLPMRDGDKERDTDKYPEYKNTIFVNASATVKYQPEVVDKNREPILDNKEIYSGMMCRAKVTAFPYKVGGSSGVGLSLGNVQKIGDGDPLGGARTRAADDFDDYEEEEETSSLLA